uniref:BTB domain-containing protein n=1 Tax=Panagrolaimus davidi TaxID=227884 RepID=A0A914P404_9BILA
MEYPIEMKWSINAENLRLPFGENLGSDIIETTIPNVSYVVCLYPNGKDKTGFVHFRFYVNSDIPVDLKLTVSIPSLDFTYRYEKAVKEFDKHFYECGSNLFSSTKLSNDGIESLTIRLFGYIKTQSRKRKFPSEIERLGHKLWKNDDKDFTFVVEDKEIKVHKLIMAGHSTVFQAMFNSSWKENEEQKALISGFPYIIVFKAVTFCYDYSLIFETYDEAMDMLEFGEYYNIQNLKDEAESYLIEQISVNNVCELSNAAVNSNAKNLRLCCFNFLIKCLKESTAVEGIDAIDVGFRLELLSKAFCVVQNF